MMAMVVDDCGGGGGRRCLDYICVQTHQLQPPFPESQNYLF